MSIYQPKGSKVWIMDFHFAGQRIRESTKTRSKSLAEFKERKRRTALEEGAAGRKKRKQPLLFSVAVEKHVEKKTRLANKQPWAPKTLAMARNSMSHLLPVFGKRLLVDIEPDDIRSYQEQRLGEGAANRSINIEVGLLRSVMGSSWARMQADGDDDKVDFLEEPESIGDKVSPEEEAILLGECTRSRCRMLFPFVTLAIETGARKNVIRTLQWKIDFTNRCIQFGKDKTPAGTGRIIPLNQRALEVLKMWALQFPDRQPEHFVFPAEKYGAGGDGFEPAVYDTDPTRPVASIKEAWEAAKKRAGVKYRFHDLKHTAVTRMLAAETPIEKVARIVGWSPSTMAEMSRRYGHLDVEDLRSAAETTTAPAISSGDSPQNPPQSETKNDAKPN